MAAEVDAAANGPKLSKEQVKANKKQARAAAAEQQAEEDTLAAVNSADSSCSSVWAVVGLAGAGLAVAAGVYFQR